MSSNLKNKQEKLLELSSSIKLIFWSALVINALILISDVFHFRLVQHYRLYEADIDPVLSLTIIRQTLLWILAGFIGIFVLVYFLRWFYHAYRYLKYTSGSNYLSYKPGAAIWSWFIPVANLIIPYQIMTEIFSEYRDLAAMDSKKYNSKLVGWWWIVGIISIIASIFEENIMLVNSHQAIENVSISIFKLIVPQIISIISIIITLKLIGKIDFMIHDTVGA